MRKVRLGRTGVMVSGLCFGTMSFGREADECEAARMYSACREHGIDFFDCANIYGGGAAEEILGRLIAHERDDLIITSKVGFAGHGDRGELTRRAIIREVDASLGRLGTDRLDILFVHTRDPATPVRETMRALDDLVRAGKVVSLGASNWAAWQVAEANGIARQHGWSEFDAIQPMYSLVKRQAEVELLPMAQAMDLAVTPYSPAAGGLLTGKYAAPDTSGRLAEVPRYAARYSEAWMAETAVAFARKARALDVHPMSLAVAWVASHPGVTAPIIGARTVEQLAPSLAALDLELTPELRAEIAALSRMPPPATDRLEEQI